MRTVRAIGRGATAGAAEFSWAAARPTAPRMASAASRIDLPPSVTVRIVQFRAVFLRATTIGALLLAAVATGCNIPADVPPWEAGNPVRPLPVAPIGPDINLATLKT